MQLRKKRRKEREALGDKVSLLFVCSSLMTVFYDGCVNSTNKLLSWGFDGKEGLRLEPLVLQIKRKQLVRRVLLGGAEGRTQDMLDRLCFGLGLCVPLDEFEEMAGKREVWASMLRQQ